MPKRSRAARKQREKKADLLRRNKQPSRALASASGPLVKAPDPRLDPQAVYQQAFLAIEAGDNNAAIDLLIPLTEYNPEFFPAWATLAGLYLRRMYPAFALRCARIALTGDLEQESEDRLREIMEIARRVICEDRFLKNMPDERAEEASLFHETALQCIETGRHEEALAAAEETIHLAPGFPSPRNNRALMLFLLGRAEEALEECRYVLERIDEENLFARSNLASFLCVLGRFDDAAQDLARLRAAIPQAAGMDSTLLHTIARSFALAEERDALHELAAVLSLEDISRALPDTRYILAADCFNAGALERAGTLLSLAPRVPQDTDGVSELRARICGKPKSAERSFWRIPYLFRCPFVSAAAQNDFGELMKLPEKLSADQMTEALQQVYTKHPALLHEMGLRLHNPEDSEMAAQILAEARMPAAAFWLRRFAEGDNGPDSARMHAASCLTKCADSRPATLKFWQTDLQRWTEISTRQNIIADPEEPSYAPSVMDALEKGVFAMREEDYAVARKFFQRAIQLDPHCGQAYYNLGVIQHEDGKIGAADDLFRKSVEMQPDYWNGHVALASIAEIDGDIPAAREYLSSVFTASRITPEVAAKAFFVQLKINARVEDLEGACSNLLSLEKVAPRAPFLKEARQIVRQLKKNKTEIVARKAARKEKVRERMAQPLSAPISLAAAITRLVDLDQMMVASFHRIGYREKKDNLPERIAKALLRGKTPASWKRTLKEMTPRARDCLGWLLDAPEGRPFDEFAMRYADGSDGYFASLYTHDESPAGELWCLGLLAAGIKDGHRIVVVSADLQPVLLAGIMEDKPAGK